jgi:hypothetical protein
MCREGYRLENLSRLQLERKVELCRNYCSIFSILEPGTPAEDTSPCFRKWDSNEENISEFFWVIM